MVGGAAAQRKLALSSMKTLLFGVALVVQAMILEVNSQRFDVKQKGLSFPPSNADFIQNAAFTQRCVNHYAQTCMRISSDVKTAVCRLLRTAAWHPSIRRTCRALLAALCDKQCILILASQRVCAPQRKLRTAVGPVNSIVALTPHRCFWLLL